MIWQRSEIESTRYPSRSLILTRKFRIGIRVSGSAPADTTSRSRSGMRASPRACGGAEVGEERVDPFPHLLTAAQPAPADADQADQLEAPIDGRDVVIARAAHAVDEQRLHLWLELAQHRVIGEQLVPPLEAEHRLGRPRRAGIEGTHTAGAAARVQEGHVHRDRQRLPLHVVHREVVEVEQTPRDAAIALLSLWREEDRARRTAAADLPGGRLEKMLVVRVRRELGAAQLAALRGHALADEAAKSRNTSGGAHASRAGIAIRRTPDSSRSGSGSMRKSEPMPAPARRMSYRPAHAPHTSTAPSRDAASMPPSQAGHLATYA